jgi:hypothetical protein
MTEQTPVVAICWKISWDAPLNSRLTDHGRPALLITRGSSRSTTGGWIRGSLVASGDFP